MGGQENQALTDIQTNNIIFGVTALLIFMALMCYSLYQGRQRVAVVLRRRLACSGPTTNSSSTEALPTTYDDNVVQQTQMGSSQLPLERLPPAYVVAQSGPASPSTGRCDQLRPDLQPKEPTTQHSTPSERTREHLPTRPLNAFRTVAGPKAIPISAKTSPAPPIINRKPVPCTIIVYDVPPAESAPHSAGFMSDDKATVDPSATDARVFPMTEDQRRRHPNARPADAIPGCVKRENGACCTSKCPGLLPRLECGTAVCGEASEW